MPSPARNRAAPFSVVPCVEHGLDTDRLDRGDPADAAREAAASAGLTYVSDERPGVNRRKVGKSFRYMRADGQPVGDAATLTRIRSLAIPPAWTEVWICPAPNGHIQATGRDARRRKQYKYHPDFRQVRESSKYEHMVAFAQSLPAIRTKIGRHMRSPGLGREKVLATVVNLLETTLIRVGNDDYAKQNQSYGLTTLRNRHVRVNGSELRFNFTGKGGKTWRLGIKDRRVAKVVRACQELPGQELFQYLDEQGETRSVTSSDINDYLRQISGQDITAKDFRTWAGTLMTALALRELDRTGGNPRSKKTVATAVARVAERLGNTPTICRKCYIHPEILSAYAEGALHLQVNESKRRRGQLGPEEAAVLAFLRRRLSRPRGTMSQLVASQRRLERAA